MGRTDSERMSRSRTSDGKMKRIPDHSSIRRSIYASISTRSWRGTTYAQHSSKVMHATRYCTTTFIAARKSLSQAAAKLSRESAPKLLYVAQTQPSIMYHLTHDGSREHTSRCCVHNQCAPCVDGRQDILSEHHPRGIKPNQEFLAVPTPRIRSSPGQSVPQLTPKATYSNMSEETI